MDPFSPEQRTEILARNPAATEADLDALQALTSQLLKLEEAPLDFWGDVETAGTRRRAALANLEARIADLRNRAFPVLEEALEAVALRDDDVELA